MQEPIGFTWQSWNDGACGKYALQHSLLLLGIPVTQKDANKATGTPPFLNRIYGTNEDQIKAALEYFDCRGRDYYLSSPKKAQEKTDIFLRMGCPVIVCVEDDSHWAVIAGKNNAGKYYWIDSADDDLIGC